MPINNLPTTTDPLTSNDSIPYALNGGATTYQTTLARLLAWIQSVFTSPDFTVQTGAPASGATQTVGALSTNVWLLIAPTGTIATLTIALPPSTSAADGQTVMISTSQQITALTVTASGATVSGVPVGLLAWGSVTLRYNTAALTWYAVSASLPLTTVTSAIIDVNGNELVKFTATANAVNEVTINNALTGGPPVISATGTDPNIGLNIIAKGTGEILIGSPGGATRIGLGGLDSVVIDAPSTFQSSAQVIGTVETSAGVIVPAGLFANLPAAASNLNCIRIITNCNVTTPGSIAAGAGANRVLVVSDGTNWLVG